MAKQNAIRCLVDDTALTRNIAEIESWVAQGKICLVVPLYTIGRLHVLKKDPSQIGVNARKAVKFLDRSTSSRDDLAYDPVTLQGPDEEYSTWAEVEAHYLNDDLKKAGENEEALTVPLEYKKGGSALDLTAKGTAGAANALSQVLLDKLNFSKDPTATSPASTPPLSPASSGLQSSKTSPEIKSATMIKHDQTPVPPSLKPLLNSVVWYLHERNTPLEDHLVFLTNSADTMHLARDFGVPTKNIHQLRRALGIEDTEEKLQDNNKKEPTKKASPGEPKTLFSYHDVESDDEEVVFKPRGRGSSRGGQPTRAAAIVNGRGKGAHGRSPRASFSTQVQPSQNKPQIPVEEIDPDSFDRGSFGRGSIPLANVGGAQPNLNFNGGRAPGYRGNHGLTAGRGANFSRGYGRGVERGSARGRGRLFVP
ncbi:uncharacterized protein PV06_05659 [Exophiala oligosperma]|uniref:PIN domain-containing protein n=1 Tax=Exophiala oligosperma TaxID=215243 RepID=A0A0D2DI36_9EURO|nr:uncharacterized protein PV06_05659 [Exophiala oligosperma]KIW42075.1 hypothetical protein PV06_05659 [Exophiala oligosperma]